MPPRLTDEDAEAVRKWLNDHEFEHVMSRGGSSAGLADSQDVWERDGTKIRLTRDRGEWWYDLSRSGATAWLDVDRVAGAMGTESAAPVERVADMSASMNDQVFDTLSNSLPHSP